MRKRFQSTSTPEGELRLNHPDFELLRAQFDRVSELTPDERRKELDRIRAQDSEMADELASLLDFHDPKNEALSLPVEKLLKEIHGQPPLSNQAFAKDFRELSQRFKPQSGTRNFEFAGYRLNQCLSSNASGVTYQAYDLQLQRNVALVLTYPRFSDQASAREKFIASAREAGTLFHPNLAAILSVVDSAGVIGFARQWIEGRDLAAWAQKQSTLELNRIISIGIDIASGLQALHDRHLLHRDVKPANVIMQEFDQRAVLTDYGTMSGIARSSQLNEEVGTRGFIAPEVTAGAPPEARSDLYSLGIVLYWLMSGTIQVPPDSRAKLPPLIADTPREAKLCRLVLDLVAKDVANRPGSANAVIEALQQLNGSSGESQLSQPPTAQTVIFYRDTSRRKWLANATGLAATAIGSLIVGRAIGHSVAEETDLPNPVSVPATLADFEAGWRFSPNDIQDVAHSKNVGIATREGKKTDAPNRHYFFPNKANTWGEVQFTAAELPARHHATNLITWNIVFDCEPKQAFAELYWSSTGRAFSWQRIVQLESKYRGYNEQFTMCQIPNKELDGVTHISFKIRMYSSVIVDSDIANPSVMLYCGAHTRETQALRLLLWEDDS